MAALPLSFRDEDHQVDYRIGRPEESQVEMVVSRGGEVSRLRLLWAFGAGRKGITFVGQDAHGAYVESRVSWYSEIDALDLTTGAENRPVRNAEEALGRFLEAGERTACFGCHVSMHADSPPETIPENSAGVSCERCHGPGQKHIRAVQLGLEDPSISDPGKMDAKEQLRLCGECHRQPSQNFGQVMTDDGTIRFPAQRLVLSRCYDESDGQLKYTTCHDPHQKEMPSLQSYDTKCRSCHAGENSLGSVCPVSIHDCVSCHMPGKQLIKHSVFLDHWIRKGRTPDKRE